MKTINEINNYIVMMQHSCDSMDAFDCNTRPVVMSSGLSYEVMEHKCKCEHCGQWGEAKNECSYCGAPIDG